MYGSRSPCTWCVPRRMAPAVGRQVGGPSGGHSVDKNVSTCGKGWKADQQGVQGSGQACGGHLEVQVTSRGGGEPLRASVLFQGPGRGVEERASTGEV